MNPTAATYAALDAAFEYFNHSLFDAALPPCLITLRSSRRSYGHLHSRRFVNVAGEQADELALNPGYFALQSIEEVMSTIVHEMVHHWQHHLGKPSRSTPHNTEWANKMEAIGLMPSSTGQPGGKRTGHRVADYILPGGAFIKACEGMPRERIALPWLDRHLPIAPAEMAQMRTRLRDTGAAVVGESMPVDEATANGVELKLTPRAPRTPSRRVKHECPGCRARAWAPPETRLSCGACAQALVPVQVSVEAESAPGN
jgi:hypothetical protein